MKNYFYSLIALLSTSSLSLAQVAQQAAPMQGPGNQLLQINNPVLIKESKNSGQIQSSNFYLQPPINPNSVPAGQHVCKAHELNEKHFQQRGVLNEYNQSYLQSAYNMNVTPPVKTPGVNEIAVIFHVVHNTNNPAENVSNALIMQVWQDLTDDFQLLNADAASARTGLGFIPADANINFCLATQDPFGTPLAELGVIRVTTTEDWYDSNNGEENEMKSAATGGSTIWDRNKYLNVWICDISNGAGSGTAGYAYRPTPTFLPGSAIDGIVLDYNLGMNNDNVLTHEVGHYLGLDHTWGGSGGCGNDDGFGDTPNTDGPSFNYPGSCSGSQSTCPAIETQYENYMDYANCTVMFTQNQADFMLLILQGIRSSLLISPGCDPTNTPPNSAFISIPAGPGPVMIPVGGAVNFIDQSTNVPTGWTWTISGTPGVDWNWINGTNASSQDPDAEFYNVGLYDVTLTASNGFGVDATPAIENGYVQVVAPASGTACDTLRNYVPAASYWTLTTGDGYIHGNTTIGGQTALEWAEPYFSLDTIRAIEFAPTRVEDGGGSVIFKVYADAGGIPGAVLTSETVLLADLVELAWNNVTFTTPYASPTGSIWVGFELSYASTDTFALLSDYTPAPAPPASNWSFVNRSVAGWQDAGALFGGAGFAHVFDVLTSNGPPPIMTFTATDNEVCVGGDIIVNGSGSQNNVDYRWYVTDEPWTTTLETSNTAGNTFNFPYAPGLYNIYLFGDASCITNGVYLPITLDAPVAATVNATNTTCGMNDGTITISGESGGDGTYYYSLDGINYQTGNVFSNLPDGTYDVYVATFGDNCETMYSVTINPSVAATATVSPNTSVCPGGSATIWATGGGTYQWFDGVTLLGTSASIIVTPGNTTQFTCMVTDGVGCQATVSTTVTVNQIPAAPVITPGGPTTFCAGSSVDLTSSYPSGNDWSTAETSSTITVNSSGSITVTYTDGNGCSNTSAATIITVNPAPSISAGAVNDPTACATSTGSIEITGSGTGDVSWTGTASGSAIGVTLPYTIPGLAAGSYNITFTDGIGCVSNLITQGLNDPTPPATPIITPSGPTTFCAGGSVDLTSSYGSNNSWTTAETTQTINITGSGSYSVTYTDGFGCSATSAPTVITVNPNPPAPTITPGGPTTFCAGGSVDLTSSQGAGNSWSTFETTQTINVTTTGTYTVTYTNANGCSNISAPISVTVNALPSAPVITPNGPTTFCAGGSVDLTSSQGSGNVWSTSETTNTITLTSSGNIDVTYTDGNGCSATSAVTTITVNPLPIVSAGPDQTVCEGTSITLCGSGGVVCSWDNGITDCVAFPASASTIYTVTCTDANGCFDSDPTTITVNPLPIVTLGALGTTCINYAPTVLSGESPAGGTFSGTGVVGGSFDPAIAGIGTFTITYSFTDGNGCTNTAMQDIIVDGCVSIGTIDYSQINVFPNPSDQELTIELSGAFDFTIIDIRGRLIEYGEAEDSITLNTANYESGVYFVNINTDSKITTVRVVKK